MFKALRTRRRAAFLYQKGDIIGAAGLSLDLALQTIRAQTKAVVALADRGWKEADNCHCMTLELPYVYEAFAGGKNDVPPLQTVFTTLSKAIAGTKNDLTHQCAKHGIALSLEPCNQLPQNPRRHNTRFVAALCVYYWH
jgi:hypothetical protein